METKKISKDTMLREMKKRKSAVQKKMMKTADRIRLIEDFKKQTIGKDVTFEEYLKAKNIDINKFFAPMGYYTGAEKVVSNDKENLLLVYCQGMEFNPKAGYHTPSRKIVSEKDHNDVIQSNLGMTWNPKLSQYFPTTIFDTNAYSSAEGSGDTGIDIMGGLRVEDFSNLNNKSYDGEDYTCFVQDLLIEEYDNLEGELDLIEGSIDSLYSDFVSSKSEIRKEVPVRKKEEVQRYITTKRASFEGEEEKSQGGKNLRCRTICTSKHAFNKNKRQECFDECDKKFKPSKKQEERRAEREERKESRKEFREDKKNCKERLRKGEINQKQYRDCLKAERKEKKTGVKEAGGTFFVRAWRSTAKVFPITLIGRNGALFMIGENAFGFGTRVAPALLSDEEAKKIFKPESIKKSKQSWLKLQKAWKNLGGDVDALKKSILKGYKKKAMKIEKKSNFEGSEYTYSYQIDSDYSNFFEPITTGTLVTAGVSVVTSLIPLIGNNDKDPFVEGQTPTDYKESLKSGDVDNIPTQGENTPIVDPNTGDWIDPNTGKKIDPNTGKYDDNILGMNKWVAIGLGVGALVGVYYLTKKK